MTGTGEGPARWIRVAGIAAAIVVLLVVAGMLIGGGDLGHRIPDHGGSASPAGAPKGAHE
ncbi:hypothetical protein AB0M50_23970 [Nonomuraea fuscirosea]|uniref:hypothetical protein n=1 Tax=Nonomuraea fuscirosea TaxID=1291556 RepID=UPI003446ED96